MATKYATQIARAQARIQAKGQLVTYYPVLPVTVPYNSDMPWIKGNVSPPLVSGLHNIVNSDYPDAVGHNAQEETTASDPDAPLPPVMVYAVFLDSKGRGSDTQGMARELIRNTQVAGGNKECLIAGGVGIVPALGDLIDRNGTGISGYPIATVSKIKSIDVDGYPILYTLELET